MLDETIFASGRNILTTGCQRSTYDRIVKASTDRLHPQHKYEPRSVDTGRWESFICIRATGTHILLAGFPLMLQRRRTHEQITWKIVWRSVAFSEKKKGSVFRNWKAIKESVRITREDHFKPC